MGVPPAMLFMATIAEHSILMADSSSIIEGGVNAIYDNPCGSNVTELSISGVGTSGVYFNDASAGDYALSAVSNALGAALASNNLAFSDEGISGLNAYRSNDGFIW